VKKFKKFKRFKKVKVTKRHFAIAIMRALEANHSINLSQEELDKIYDKIELLEGKEKFTQRDNHEL
jgi:hypothetical protein